MYPSAYIHIGGCIGCVVETPSQILCKRHGWERRVVRPIQIPLCLQPQSLSSIRGYIRPVIAKNMAKTSVHTDFDHFGAGIKFFLVESLFSD